MFQMTAEFVGVQDPELRGLGDSFSVSFVPSNHASLGCSDLVTQEDAILALKCICLSFQFASCKLVWVCTFQESLELFGELCLGQLEFCEFSVL